MSETNEHHRLAGGDVMTPEQTEAIRQIIITSALWGWDACRSGATRSEAEDAASMSAERLIPTQRAEESP